MGNEIKPSQFLYLPAVDSIEHLREHLKKSDTGTVLVLGEYGLLHPFAMVNDVRGLWKGDIFIELTAAGKNRDLIRSHLVSAEKSGFAGVLLAAGKFSRTPGMGKPVFDLDPAQMLRLAMEMKKAGVLPENFTIALRSPEGGEAACARTRFFLENGADLVVCRNTPPDDLKDRVSLIREI